MLNLEGLYIKKNGFHVLLKDTQMYTIDIYCLFDTLLGHEYSILHPMQCIMVTQTQAVNCLE